VRLTIAKLSVLENSPVFGPPDINRKTTIRHRMNTECHTDLQW